MDSFILIWYPLGKSSWLSCVSCVYSKRDRVKCPFLKLMFFSMSLVPPDKDFPGSRTQAPPSVLVSMPIQDAKLNVLLFFLNLILVHNSETQCLSIDHMKIGLDISSMRTTWALRSAVTWVWLIFCFHLLIRLKSEIR